jgi:hypothetical protein
MQKQSAVVKTLDLYYRKKNKLDSFLISIDIYILFNTYLFNTETAKIFYAINYFREYPSTELRPILTISWPTNLLKTGLLRQLG